MYDANPHISEMMLTGGSPTMHPKIVNELTHLANERDIFITIETEGSHFLATDYPINLLSISPKFSNSVPVLGVETPQGAITDQKMIDRHNKFRVNKDAIKKSIDYHLDYHIKPVLDKDLSMVKEVEEFLKDLEIPDNKVWAMPAGDDREALFESYGPVMNFVRDRGWRYTGRSHIMAFGTERCV
jgi:7-carboxy-7-deazaguanine synthase